MGKIFHNFCSQEGCSTDQWVCSRRSLCLLPFYPETQLPPCCHPKPKCRSVLFTIWHQMFSFYELPRPQRMNPSLVAHAPCFPFTPTIAIAWIAIKSDGLWFPEFLSVAGAWTFRAFWPLKLKQDILVTPLHLLSACQLWLFVLFHSYEFQFLSCNPLKKLWFGSCNPLLLYIMK